MSTYLRTAALLVALGLVPAAFGQSADLSAGRKRAGVCFACHGENGLAKVRGTPHLAGQDRTYLEKALRAYRDGQQRQDSTMTAMARPLSDADIVNVSAYFNAQILNARGVSLADNAEIEARIRPVGDSYAVARAPVATPGGSAAPAKPAATRDGATVYSASCAACHDTGAAGAPKLGDKPAWQPRIAQGSEAIYKHVFAGLNAMPPRGACINCSDAELKAAADHLIAKGRP